MGTSGRTDLMTVGTMTDEERVRQGMAPPRSTVVTNRQGAQKRSAMARARKMPVSLAPVTAMSDPAGEDAAS